MRRRDTADNRSPWALGQLGMQDEPGTRVDSTSVHLATRQNDSIKDPEHRRSVRAPRSPAHH